MFVSSNQLPAHLLLRAGRSGFTSTSAAGDSFWEVCTSASTFLFWGTSFSPGMGSLNRSLLLLSLSTVSRCRSRSSAVISEACPLSPLFFMSELTTI
eukprot:UN13447